jgi:hypothetical protein
MPDVHFSIELEGDDVDINVLGGIAKELGKALEDVESNLTDSTPKVTWHIEDQAVLRAFASSNGVSEATLRTIAERARDGFESVEQAAGGQINWPPGIGPRAQSAIAQIVGYLSRVDSITIDVEGQDPVTLNQSVVLETTQVVTRPHRELSTLDGKLDLISVRSNPRFVVEEHGTGRRVPCSFPDVWIERVKDALGKRVIVEGLIRYKWNGVPTSVSHIRSLTVRPPPALDLESLVGSLPDLIGGEDPGDYVRSMRENRDA